MSNFPNMSYCMFENTAAAMDQILVALEEVDTVEELDLNQYEGPHIKRLPDLCCRILDELERLGIK